MIVQVTRCPESGSATHLSLGAEAPLFWDERARTAAKRVANHVSRRSTVADG